MAHFLICPEQIRARLRRELDLWASPLAFEMLTGVHPFGTSADWRSVLIENASRAHFDAPALTGSLKSSSTLSVSRSPRNALLLCATHVELQAAL